MDALATAPLQATAEIKEKWRILKGGVKKETRAGDFLSVSRLKFSGSRAAPKKIETVQARWEKSFLRADGEISHSHSEDKIGVVDLYSGCGGFSLGVKEAANAVGLQPVYRLAADIDPAALGVYRENLKPVDAVSQSVADLVEFRVGQKGPRVDFSFRPEIMNKALASAVDRVTLVVGGPPCQGHSNFNNISRRSDPRNYLYLTMPAVAVALNAPLVVIENVSEVLNDSTNVVERAIRVFESEGYQVSHTVVRGIELGLSQTRRRHILVASKFSKPDFSGALAALKRRQGTVKDAIGDLRGKATSSDIFDAPVELSKENIKRIKHLFDNELYELPNEVRPDCHKDGHTYPSVYGRLSWDKPSGTITTGFLSPGRGRFTHPSEQRALTPHEAARLQGFPDDFSFTFDGGQSLRRKEYSKLIGDAVPPVIGKLATLVALSTIPRDQLRA